jgi:REP-associated tyrosine transposase
MDWRSRSMRRRAVNEPGHAHELTFTCFRRYRFLKAEQTCQWLADAIDGARKKLEFAVLAYVFMPEHVHLIIHPKHVDYDIRLILQKIKEPVGRRAVRHLLANAPHWLPRISVKRGNRVERRFWQAGGGFDRNVVEPKTILAMIEYIHANPVRRGLVSLEEQWKWSSAGWFEGKNSLRPDLVELGGLCVFFDGRG